MLTPPVLYSDNLNNIQLCYTLSFMPGQSIFRYIIILSVSEFFSVEWSFSMFRWIRRWPISSLNLSTWKSCGMFQVCLACSTSTCQTWGGKLRAEAGAKEIKSEQPSQMWNSISARLKKLMMSPFERTRRRKLKKTPVPRSWWVERRQCGNNKPVDKGLRRREADQTSRRVRARRQSGTSWGKDTTKQKEPQVNLDGECSETTSTWAGSASTLNRLKKRISESAKESRLNKSIAKSTNMLNKAVSHTRYWSHMYWEGTIGVSN